MRDSLVLLIGLLLVLGVACFLFNPVSAVAQNNPYPDLQRFPKPDDEGPRLPNGKLQRDVILKFEHGKNLEDLKEIKRLSTDLIEELEKNTEHVLSIKSLKQLEEIEELAKDVRKRMKK